MAAAPKITCFPAVTLTHSPIWESRVIIFAITTTPYDNSVVAPQICGVAQHSVGMRLIMLSSSGRNL